MNYSDVIEARFVSRQNRFVSKCLVDGELETVHVKNTGRLKELLKEDSKVFLEKSHNPDRKTKFDLIAVENDDGVIFNIDSISPNKAVKEYLEEGRLIKDIKNIKPEYTLNDSRFDFYFEDSRNRRYLLEVKGVTLLKDGFALFPDAPTSRGIKHLNELEKATNEGYECYIAFGIAMPKVTVVHPNISTHPEFGQALSQAMAAGVRVLNLTCDITPTSISINSTK